MKFLILLTLAATVFSTKSFADEEKCYYRKTNEMVIFIKLRRGSLHVVKFGASGTAKLDFEGLRLEPGSNIYKSLDEGKCNLSFGATGQDNSEAIIRESGSCSHPAGVASYDVDNIPLSPDQNLCDVPLSRDKK